MRTNLIKTKELPKVVESSTTDGMLDMVIAFDTTGSMSAYINAVKTHVKELVPKLFSSNPDLRIGIVAFGDYCDMKSKDNFGKAYQVLGLTNDENEIIKFINEAQNTSGGDGDEFYELVIKKITEETAWREGSTKAVLLIADAAPHRVGYSYKGIVSNAQIDWREEAKKASELGIKFDTMTIDSLYSEWYKELSAMTNGVSVPFKNSSKTSQVIEAAALSRGGERTKALYEATMDSFAAMGDMEMTAVYNAYSKSGTMKINIKEVAVGDVFSEESHYIVEEIGKDTIKFKHTESGKSVTLGYGYVQDLLNTSDQYDKEVKVTKEDKKDGTPGIRTIFEGIKSSEVFTVVFQKQDKAKTKKQYEAEREAQRQEAVALIDKAKKAKKSMATAYKEALEHIQNNPIKDFIEGEDRVLRGYKMQFVSRDGKYKCLDMDVVRSSKEDGIRLVNINTIKALVFNGVKYVVK